MGDVRVFQQVGVAGDYMFLWVDGGRGGGLSGRFGGDGGGQNRCRAD